MRLLAQNLDFSDHEVLVATGTSPHLTIPAGFTPPQGLVSWQNIAYRVSAIIDDCMTVESETFRVIDCRDRTVLIETDNRCLADGFLGLPRRGWYQVRGFSALGSPISLGTEVTVRRQYITNSGQGHDVTYTATIEEFIAEHVAQEFKEKNAVKILQIIHL